LSLCSISDPDDVEIAMKFLLNRFYGYENRLHRKTNEITATKIPKDKYTETGARLIARLLKFRFCNYKDRLQ
jgi:hypothetical protein